MKKTIFVATPCFNSKEYIDRAILSVVSQSGDFKIRYHVQDGGSNDGTVERLKWWVATLESGRFPVQCRDIHMTYQSEPDGGMYDALTKAFLHLSAPPDAFATWINSDDILLPDAFSAVAKIAEDFDSGEVAWLTGQVSISNLNGIAYSWFHERPPTKGIALGLCDGRFLPFVQQEGTFFRGWLWNKFAQEGAFGDLKMAGDWLLWTKFAQDAELFELDQPLGRFHQREGQISENMVDYLGEIDRIVPESDRAARLMDLLKNSALTSCHLDWDSHTEAFKALRFPTSRSRLSSVARSHRPELRDQITTIMEYEMHVAADTPRELMRTADDLLRKYDKTSFRKMMDDLTSTKEKYRNLLAGDLIALVETDKIDTVNWRTALIRRPWEVGFWRALRRYQRRSKQNL